MERQCTMARYFENYVKFYGTMEEASQAMRTVTSLAAQAEHDDGPELFDSWTIGRDFVVLRLDSFRTEHWDSPSDYLSELSEKYPNVVIEWSYLGDHDFYCSVLKNGHSLAEYEACPADKGFAEKSYYLEASRLVELADAS
jgi:hypothetical protein